MCQDINGLYVRISNFLDINVYVRILLWQILNGYVNQYRGQRAFPVFYYTSDRTRDTTEIGLTACGLTNPADFLTS